VKARGVTHPGLVLAIVGSLRPLLGAAAVRLTELQNHNCIRGGTCASKKSDTRCTRRLVVHLREPVPLIFVNLVIRDATCFLPPPHCTSLTSGTADRFHRQQQQRSFDFVHKEIGDRFSNSALFSPDPPWRQVHARAATGSSFSISVKF